MGSRHGLNPSYYRNAGVLHRDGITVVDKLTPFANTDLSTADNGVGTGSLTNGVTYYITAIPGNRWGPCSVAATINSQLMGAGAATHSLRLTLPQCVAADYYDLFLSTDAAPKWVGRIAEAQRAAGDFEVTAVGVVAPGGGNPAGTVDINVAGTQAQTSNAMFAQNNAYRPDNALILPVDCAGYSKAYVYAKLALTDLRSAPSLTVIPFFANQVSATDWHQGQPEVLNLLQALGQPLEQAFALDVHGSTGLKILVGTIAGQGAAASVWVELV